MIKEYDVFDKKQLEALETLWINKLKCCNKNQPFRINYLYNKKWETENKIHRSNYKKEFNDKNKDKIRIQKKEYNEKNKDYLKSKAIEWRVNNKEKLKEKIMCECGSNILKRHKTDHIKTKKHQNFVLFTSDVKK